MEHSLKQCEICGATIAKERNRNWNEYAKKRFCSLTCSGQSQSRKVRIACAACGKEVERSPSHVRGAVYCSRECRRKEQSFTCEICGKQFTERPSSRAGAHVYCGTACQGMAKRKVDKPDQGRRHPDDLAWKAAVLRRDGYRCQHCGTDRKLEAHHIIEIRQRPELRHELSNGLTLCHQCHYYGVHGGKPNLIHGRYSKPQLSNPAPQVPA